MQVIFALFVLLLHGGVSAKIASTSDARLPQGLFSVLSDLEGAGVKEVASVCLLTSRSVNVSEKQELACEILGEATSAKAAATAAGLVVAQPDNCWEAASTAESASSIFYYADPTDLRRGEGLFEQLGPALEHASGKTLYVLTENKKVTERRLEELVQRQLLPNLVVDKNVCSLSDVFESVQYLSPSDAAAKVTKHPIVKNGSADSPLGTITEYSAANLAAARRWGPAGRRKFDSSLDQVLAACRQNEQPKLVPEFGQLCKAVLKQAKFDNEAASAPVAKELQSNLVSSLESFFAELLEEQLDLLELACFESFKKDLSKLLISPNLETDMMAMATKAVAAFGKQGRRLLFGSSGNLSARQSAFATRLKEYVRRRILVAQAAGKFRPLPRKGVTVGLHWLLPKPFGNDYRQEPWMVHATDSMVYVPESKVTDVSPEEVASGTWRDKIVPSPSGNDMLYMQ